MNNEGYTVIEISKSAWASTRLQEPWAITLGPGRWGGMEIKFHTLGQVLGMVIAADLGPSASRNIPGQVNTWITTLGLAPVNAIGQATKSLSQDQNLDILAVWFNGGAGLPSPSTRPESKHTNTKVRLYLGHPALLNQFLRWLIRYLGAHETVDGRVDRDCERVINVCRECQDKSPVRRY